MIHHPDPSNATPVPLYSAVRASVTSSNHDWFETNNIPSQTNRSSPSWVQKLAQTTQRLVAREEAPEALDTDTSSEDTDDEFQGDMATGEAGSIKVHPYRFRFWGMASSPGGGVTAALVSKYSTQFPCRRGLSRVLFSTPQSSDQQQISSSSVERMQHQGAATGGTDLTTEGRIWEWMYGGGPHVDGATIAASANAHNAHTESPLRRFFGNVKARQQCVFCDSGLTTEGTEARCRRAHTFGESLACQLSPWSFAPRSVDDGFNNG